MIKPITPEEVGQAKSKYFPEFVFEAFNFLIAAEYTDKWGAKFDQNKVIDKIIELANIKDLTRQEIFDNGWLNVESVYQDVG